MATDGIHAPALAGEGPSGVAKSAMQHINGQPLSEAVLAASSVPQPGMGRLPHPSPFAQDTGCDEFRMYSFKIDACPKLSEIHDWNECPYLHPGEKARRRDPRVWSYQSLPCPEFRKGMCKRGDGCPFAHGVFECWLHPTRYRTTLCKEGGACSRPICFFAHSVAQLRDPTTPAPAAGAAGPATPGALSAAAPRMMSTGTLSTSTLSTSAADSRCGSPAALSTSLPSDNLSTMLVSDGEAAAVAAAVAVRAQQQQAAAAAQAHALVTRLLGMERSTSGSLPLPSVAGSCEVSTDSVDLDGVMGAREAAALRQLMAGLAL